MRGKQTCIILKDIRRQIAEANDIHLVTEECTYKGECEGTCPRCEAEVRYLEQELAYRKQIGKAVCITGLAIGAMSGMSAQAQTTESSQCSNQPDNNRIERQLRGVAPRVVPQNDLSDADSIVVRGTVVDEKGEPIVGASISDGNLHHGTVSDYDGTFTLRVSKQTKTLRISYIGCMTEELEVEADMLIRMKQEPMLMGEVVVTGKATPKNQMTIRREARQRNRAARKAEKKNK